MRHGGHDQSDQSSSPAREVEVLHGLGGLKDAIGTHLGYSAWMSINQRMVDQFAVITGDHQWIHTDVERAADGPFGGTIAHGYLTLALIPQLLGQIFRLAGVTMEVNYGLDRVRFPNPLRTSSRVRAGAEVLEVKPSYRGSLATIRVEIEIEGCERPACVADTLVLVLT